MFTGIITNLGKLINKEQSVFTFQTDASFCRKVKNGTSVAVNGVCLTVVASLTPGVKHVQTPGVGIFSITVMPETARKTMLDSLQIHDLVNLELPVTPETFLSGHIVQGHADRIGIIKTIEEEENSKILTIEIPEVLNKYIVEKGSITVNGISLTVIHSEKIYFTVGIIPYTWKHTMLHKIKIGDAVNIEVDIIGKYVEKLLKPLATN